MTARFWSMAILASLMAISNPADAKEKAAPDLEASAAQKAEEDVLRKAVIHIGLHQLDEALALIDPVIAAHDAQAQSEKRVIFSARSMPETLDYLLGATGRHEDSVVMPSSWGQALFLKAFVLIDLKRGDEAKLWLDRAVAISPENAHFLGELGEWYKARGRLDEATAVFRRAESAADFSPDELKSFETARAMRGVAWVAVEQGKLDEAEAIYRQCLAMNKSDQMAQNELAYIAQQKLKTMR